MKAIYGGFVFWFLAAAASVAAEDLQTFKGCSLVPAEWADGDSFRVRFPDGNEHTVRLYGVDCFETKNGSATDARRLRAQRRYFGISEVGGNAAASVKEAMGLGGKAAEAVRGDLKKPFSVTTTFADAGGDGRFKRVYGFVETGGKRDLAEVLVERGLARAFGVYRRKSANVSAAEYREHLRDVELKAAKKGMGVWALTDWDKLPGERREERKDEEDLEVGRGKFGPEIAPRSVDPNTAARDLLMELPGVGEITANRIIEAREDEPYRSPADLRRVHGIGEATVEKLAPYLKFDK